MLLLIVTSSALAHVGATLEGIDVVLPGPLVEANFGLIVTDDGAPRWLCHEVLTAPKAIIAPRYTRSSAGVLLGTVPALEQSRDPSRGVYRSADGCDWSPVEGLDGQYVTRTGFAPDDPSLALAVSAELSAGESVISRSTDGGETFSPILTTKQRLFRSLRFSSSVPGEVWATSVWYAGGTGYVHFSGDGGLTWTEHAAPNPNGEEAYDVDVVAVSPTDSQTAWLVVGPYYTGDTLYRTDDGGETLTPVFELEEGDIIDGAIEPDGGLWLVASQRRLFYAADGENFVQIDEPASGVGIGVGADADGAYVLGLAQVTTILVAHTDDGGESFTNVASLLDLQPPACPAGTDVATVCDPLWETLQGRLPTELVDTGDPVEPVDSGEPDTDDGCACRGRSGGTGAAVVLALTGLLGWRRRR